MGYSKSIAAIVAAAALVLATFNINMSTELQGAIIVIGTTIAVWLAPKNQPTP